MYAIHSSRARWLIWGVIGSSNVCANGPGGSRLRHRLRTIGLRSLEVQRLRPLLLRRSKTVAGPGGHCSRRRRRGRDDWAASWGRMGRRRPRSTLGWVAGGCALLSRGRVAVRRWMVWRLRLRRLGYVGGPGKQRVLPNRSSRARRIRRRPNRRGLKRRRKLAGSMGRDGNLRPAGRQWSSMRRELLLRSTMGRQDMRQGAEHSWAVLLLCICRDRLSRSWGVRLVGRLPLQLALRGIGYWRRCGGHPGTRETVWPLETLSNGRGRRRMG